MKHNLYFKLNVWLFCEIAYSLCAIFSTRTYCLIPCPEEVSFLCLPKCHIILISCLHQLSILSPLSTSCPPSFPAAYIIMIMLFRQSYLALSSDFIFISSSALISSTIAPVQGRACLILLLENSFRILSHLSLSLYLTWGLSKSSPSLELFSPPSAPSSSTLSPSCLS